jgi:hypothetical protein
VIDEILTFETKTFASISPLDFRDVERIPTLLV